MIALRSFRLAVLATGIASALAGCGTYQGIHQAKLTSTATGNEADKYINDGMAVDSQKPAGVRVLDDQYVATDSVELAKTDDPALQCVFPYNTGKGKSLQEISADITERCGTPVRITPDAVAMLNGVYDRAIAGQGGGSAGGAPAPSAPLGQGLIAPPAAVGGPATTFGLGGASNFIEPRGNKIVIVWDKKLKGFLDTLSASTGLNYKITDGVITFYYLETRTFAVLGIPGATSLASDISSSSDTTTGLSGGSGGGSGGGGGGGQGIGGDSSSVSKMNINLTSNNLKDMENTVQNMLTPGVGRMASTFGTITVIDTPDRLRPIGAFIADRNQANTMQARFSVRVLAVQINDNSEAGFNLNALYQNLAKNYKVTIANNFTADPTATSVGANILNGNSKWAGSSAVFDLLKTVGKVTTVYDEPVSTLNMKAVSIKNIKSDMFVIGTQTTQIGTVTGGTQTSITQAVQTVGLNMQLIPFITPKADEVYLQFSMGLSDAQPLTSFTSSGSSAQQTHTTSGDNTQSVKLKSGQTLMLMGYRQANTSVNQSGAGDEHFMLLGGGQTGSKAGRYLVILITPNIQG